MTKIKFKSKKVRAHEVLEDDRIKFGGMMCKVVSNTHMGVGDRRHILAYRLGGDPHYDRIAFMVNATLKIKIYNQK